MTSVHYLPVGLSLLLSTINLMKSIQPVGPSVSQENIKGWAGTYSVCTKLMCEGSTRLHRTQCLWTTPHCVFFMQRLHRGQCIPTDNMHCASQKCMCSDMYTHVYIQSA